MSSIMLVSVEELAHTHIRGDSLRDKAAPAKMQDHVSGGESLYMNVDLRQSLGHRCCLGDCPQSRVSPSLLPFESADRRRQR